MVIGILSHCVYTDIARCVMASIGEWKRLSLRADECDRSISILMLVWEDGKHLC